MTIIRKIAVLLQTLFRPKKLLFSPIHIQLEPSSMCNMQCIHCDHPNAIKKPKNMSFKEFEVIYDKLRPQYITFNGYGEPLLAPDLPLMIAYAVNNGAKVNTTTNGLLLGKYAERLIDSGVHLINVSLDASTEEIYEKIRSKNSYKIIIENIKKFDELRKTKNKKIFLRISCVVQEANIKELKDLVVLSKNLGADMIIFQIVETRFIEDRTKDVTGILTKEDMIKHLKEAELKIYEMNIPSNIDRIINNFEMLWNHNILLKPDKNRSCWKPWNSIYITADKKVRPCCNFVSDDINLGDFDKDLNGIYNTKQFCDFRRKLSKKLRPFKPCVYCFPESLSEFLLRKKF